MEVHLPSDCGNAPRIGIVTDFVVNWAKGDTHAVSEWLADNARWHLVGREALTDPAAALEKGVPFVPERLEILAVITHGRLASCDGYVEASGGRMWFSHVFRFVNTAKTSKIAELRSYCIDAQVTTERSET